MADLLLNIIGSDQASTALRGVATGFQQLAKLAADCTKEFEQQAKADRQLERHAGDLTGAFKAQASAMQETLGVSDDMVQSMQTMLLRFGQAPESVDATVRALLDYSAATGTDAVAATQSLLTSVNSGKAAFKELGLAYDTTGKKSQDLTNVTQALADKVGGSAKAEAGSLSGQARIATEAINEFKESVGGLVSEFVTKTGAVGTFTQAIKDLQFALFGATEDSAANIQKNLDAAKEKLASMRSLSSDVITLVSGGAFGPSGDDIDNQVKEVERLEKAWKAADQATRTADRQSVELTDLAGPRDGFTNKGKKDAEKESNDRKLSDFESYAEAKTRADFELVEAQAKALAQLDEDRTKAQIADQQRYLNIEADEDKHFETRRKQLADHVQYQLDMDDKALKAAEKASKKLQDQMDRENKRTEQLARDGAMAIGLAFASALAGALAEALSGGEVDALGVAADVGFAIAAIAASTVANIYAPGSGTLVGGLIGTAGSVVHGVRAAAWKKELAGRKKHDGGWIGADRFHNGGWPGLATDEQPAVLQAGERVLARQEVQRMGGRSGVDRAARGGGAGLTINVSTMDAYSFGDYMGARGGRALYNTIRTGRGSLTQTALGGG